MRRASMTVLRCGVLVLGGVALLVGCALPMPGEDSTTPGTVDLGAGLGVEGDPGQLGTEGSVAANASAIESVVMIGDSITKGSTPALEERFELLGLDASIEAENGKRMAVSSGGNPSGSSVAEFIAGSSDDHSNELWVVALGTNDIGQYSSSDEIAAAVNEVLESVPDESPVVWVDAYYRDGANQQDVVNMIIRDRVARRGNSAVAPWTEFATGDGVLSSDGVHPTSDGTNVFAFVVTDTVSAFLGR
ncbi:MAG TPA: GDSL-type esterase/lipase family protein [Ilumatobacteraceae bacterium]|nr:GDSL-type esterase/lipase family protein [Ilumatobacteraceae bacterium]